ncbi:MAG TPA: TolC family protein [Campylobacteraceae bacterium]|nr:TolC family protein [Campylobacteraceae bacterium]
MVSKMIWALLLLIASAYGKSESDTAKGYTNLPLKKALRLANRQNIEIDIAEFDRQIARLGVKVARGYNFGKLDATVMGLRSNDAGNVFGFKLQSREATFGDFGFDQFLSGFGEAMMNPDGTMADFQTLAQNFGNPQAQQQLLDTMPDRLNYPDARDHYDVKVRYMLPLYTGFKLTNYRRIADDMAKMARLDKQKIEAQKSFEVRKTYYDISLLDKFEHDLSVIKGNIEHLRDATLDFMKEGYAKKTDLMEVESKLSNVDRMLFEARANRELSYDFLSFLLDHKVASIKHVSLDTFDCKIPLANVLKRNRDIKKANLGYKIQDEMVDVTKSAFQPEVGAFVEYGSSDDTFLGHFQDHDRYTLGVQAKMNLFSGGSDYYKLQQEKLKRLKVKRQVELARKGITLKYKKITTEIANADKQVESLKKELELAETIYQNYQERYKEGLASINDVVIKQSNQIQKLLNLLKVQNLRNQKILEVYRLAY